MCERTESLPAVLQHEDNDHSDLLLLKKYCDNLKKENDWYFEFLQTFDKSFELEWCIQTALALYRNTLQSFENTRLLTIVAGKPGVGKTEYVCKHPTQSLIIDVDDIKSSASILPNKTHCWHKPASLVAELVLCLALHYNKSVTWIATMSDRDWYYKLLRKVTDKGYKVTIIHVVCDEQERLARLSLREKATMRSVPESVNLQSEKIADNIKFFNDNLKLEYFVYES